MPVLETRTVEPDEAGMRLDRWFHVHFPDLGFGHLQKLIRSGQVRVDGGRVKTNTRLSNRDRRCGFRRSGEPGRGASEPVPRRRGRKR